MTDTHDLPLDLTAIPFSYRGSYHTLSIDQRADGPRLRLQTVRKTAISHKWQPGDDWSHDLLEITMSVDGKEASGSADATADRITLRSREATAIVIFADPETLLIRFSGCDLKLTSPRSFTSPGWMLALGPNRFRWYDGRSLHYFSVSIEGGTVARIPKDTKPDADGSGDSVTVSTGASGSAVVRLSTTMTEPVGDDAPFDFEVSATARRQEIADWLGQTPAVPAEFAGAARVAWYLFWNLQVRPAGHYRRQAVLSSKRSLSQIWSWDNCFNALALAPADHRLAWDQLLVVLDNQAESGMLPDAISDLQANFGFNKPPVWGWTTHRMLQLTPPEHRREYAEAVYPAIARFHAWWFRYRDLTGTGLPFYMHGNDSGWDNASVFDEGWPTASPDLLAFLILQAEGLGEMASLLDRPVEAADWQQSASDLLAFFHRQFVRDDSLIYYTLTPDGPAQRASTSLLTRIPIVLGERLAPAVRSRLVADIMDDTLFHAPCGPATESLNSLCYEPNGYWRGPVWGPSTSLIFDGLLQCGEIAAARDIAERYCRTCSARADFRENYDALTGAGQYDSGMTWSASDFLMLARWLAENPA